MAHLLEVTDLRVSYGAVVAVDDVSLTVDRGQIVGLIGPNGAGKSSFVDALTGYTPTGGGQVVFEGRGLCGRPAHQVARGGLARTFQSVELFDDLTVRENLLVAAARPGGWAMLRDLVLPSRPDGGDAVAWASRVCGLDELLDRPPRALSHGQRKLVGVARALAQRPRLVLMDEPAAGLDSQETAAFGDRLRTLPDHDVAVLLIDHDMGLVLDVCDQVVVLDFGRVIARGTPAQIRADTRVIDAYLGGHDAHA